ncbi:hypothetical protein SCA6_008211 [Theobroma cacao]
MERVAVASAASPASSTAAYVSWEEVNVSSDKGMREVHYYLKKRDGASDLAVVGKEKSVRHMSYHFAIKNRSLFFSSTSFHKLKSRREVVDWLNSVVSDLPSHEPYCSVDGFRYGKDVNNLDFGALMDFQSRKLGQYTKELFWLGFSWTCRKKRKHYQSFRRNGVIISIHDFVYVLAEEDKRLVAYLEDLYEDSKGNKMVVVRWFHKIDEVGIVLPHNYNSREIFSSLCLQDLSIECIDGLATVLSPEHFKKYLNEAMHTQLEPFVCCKQFENDDVKPFDVTQVKGYWKQDILRYMYSLSLSNDCVSHQQRADDQKADWNVDDGVGIRPRKKYRQSKDDDVRLHFSGSRESMDASCADVLDMGNGKNGTESFSLSGGSSAFLSADGAKQNFSQHLKVGSQVEILAQDSGIRGCWFRALIIKKHKDKVKVQYQDLQDAADEANKLEEWILASRVAVPDQMGIRFGGRTTIRPSPQNPKGSASCIDVGSVVDVWWHGGWWEGIVFKKDSEDKLHVYFPGEKRESVFDSGDVRPSQEWLGNRWINIKERHDLVSSILRGRKQDAGKSYDCNLVKTTVGDGGQFAKGATIGCNDSPVEPGNDRAKDVGLVPDLSKDDLLSQLKWKSSRKRRRGTGTSVQKQNCGRKRIKSTAEVTRSVTCERFLIPASLKLDNDNCKYRGDPLFSSSVVPPLTSLVMTSLGIEPWYLLLLLYEDLFSVYIRHREAMVFPGQAKKEVPRVELNKPKSLLLPGTCLASVESLSMPLVHEVVLSADIRCAECQRRIADIMSRMNDTDSVLVNVLEKKVTLTCRYPGIVNLASRQVPVIYRNPLCCMVMRVNIDCHGCYRKMRRILLNIKEVETHVIEKQQCRVSLCGRFGPSDVAIKIRKKMNRRVEILEIQEISEEQTDQTPMVSSQ